MPKKKFYCLCRYKDKTDGKLKAGYLVREGFDVPNDLGFNLAVYRATDEEVKTWYVVDTRCGLSVGEGSTKKEAIESSLKRLEAVDMNLYKKKVKDVEKTYGPVPGHGIMFNLCNSSGN